MHPDHDWKTFIPTTFDEIVEQIATFADIPPTDVAARTWSELLEPGWNVRQDVQQFGVTPFHYDEHMDRLYAQGDGFIFESLVYWARPARQSWIRAALERIRRHADTLGTPIGNLRVLMLGDGPGNDSLYLATAGIAVDYFEVPGSRTYDFAVRRFEHYGLWRNQVRPADLENAGSRGRYDVVVSFEVLEHLPDPIAAIAEMNSALETGGIALVSEDFGDLTEALPTHLRSSARYLGATPFLFLDEGMLLSWYNREELFKPYEFVKQERIPSGARLQLLKDPVLRGHYLSRYFNRVARFIAKLPHLRLSGSPTVRG